MLAARGLRTSRRQLRMTCGPERQDSLESVTSHFKQPQLTWSRAAPHFPTPYPHAQPPSLSPAVCAQGLRGAGAPAAALDHCTGVATVPSAGPGTVCTFVRVQAPLTPMAGCLQVSLCVDSSVC